MEDLQPKKPKRKWRLEKWAPIVIALAALLFSVTEARRGREHDRLSVRPELGIDYELNRSDSKVSIVNFGLGPARVQRVELFLSGEPIKDLDMLLSHIDAAGVTPGIRRTAMRTVLPGTSDEVFSLSWDNPSPGFGNPQRVAVAKMIQNLRAIVCYCSIYDECWSMESSHQSKANLIDGCPADYGIMFNPRPFSR